MEKYMEVGSKFIWTIIYKQLKSGRVLLWCKQWKKKPTGNILGENSTMRHKYVSAGYKSSELWFTHWPKTIDFCPPLRLHILFFQRTVLINCSGKYQSYLKRSIIVYYFFMQNGYLTRLPPWTFHMNRKANLIC